MVRVLALATKAVATSAILASAIAAGVIAASASAQAASPPELVSGGKYVLGEQPDGNSVIIHAPQGAIIVDTGRHPAHLQAVREQVTRSGQRVVAVINTHWHLDHVGGNALLRHEEPDLPVYGTDAIQQALTGFLADYRQQLQKQLDAQSDPAQQQPLRAELALIAAGQALAPNHVVARSGNVRIAGRSLQFSVEHYAHTAADLWLRDRAARVVIAGDLVVLPTPFLDTSCAPHILTALDHIAATQFDVLYPGHGPALSRSEFERYRRAYSQLLSCAASTAPTAECAAGWRRDLGSLLAQTDYPTADALIAYYMDSSLRAPASSVAALCGRA